MKNKKEELFNRIYTELKNKIYRLCLGFAGNTDDAKDLFQEILILIWNNLDSFRNESHINTWVYRIASNRAVLYIKRRNRLNTLHQENNLSDFKITTEHKDLEQEYILEEKIKQLYSAIARLNKMDRILISLLLEGCSYLEISEVTGLTTSNVGVKINRIKKTLTSRLNKL